MPDKPDPGCRGKRDWGHWREAGTTVEEAGRIPFHPISARFILSFFSPTYLSLVALIVYINASSYKRAQSVFGSGYLNWNCSSH